MNKPAYIMRDDSITVFVNGRPYTVEKSNPNFFALRKALIDANYADIPALVNVEHKIVNFSHGKLRVNDGEVFYGTEKLHGVVVTKLLELLKAGAKDAEPLLNFIDKLMSNVSANSVNELYSFLSYKSLPITPEGNFLAYKGVKNDFYSSSGNKNTVVVQGKVNDQGQILNTLGSTIEVARRSVDDNKDNHCSFGLHVGSFDYAKDWAGSTGRLLVVEVNPADAVSVPTDCSFQKLRVSKYKVHSDITPERKEISEPVYSTDDSEDDDYDCGDDCGDDCGHCDCDKDNSSDIDWRQEAIKLKVDAIISNYISKGIYPSLNYIMTSALLNYDVTYDELADIIFELDYDTNEGILKSDGTKITASEASIVESF
jgi:hypothetical protein